MTGIVDLTGVDSCYILAACLGLNARLGVLPRGKLTSTYFISLLLFIFLIGDSLLTLPELFARELSLANMGSICVSLLIVIRVWPPPPVPLLLSYTNRFSGG